MNSKTNHLLLPFSIFGVSLLGLVLLNNEPRRVTPPYIKESREDSIKRVKRYKEELRRDSIFFAKVDSIKVGSINSIFYFLHKAAEPFNCLEQDNLA